jgi:hypothetical protein
LARLVDEVLDQPEPLELVARVDPHAPDRPGRPDQPQPLVLPQRLRVHPEQLRRHADEEQVVADAHGWRTLMLRRHEYAT